MCVCVYAVRNDSSVWFIFLPVAPLRSTAAVIPGLAAVTITLALLSSVLLSHLLCFHIYLSKTLACLSVPYACQFVCLFVSTDCLSISWFSLGQLFLASVCLYLQCGTDSVPTSILCVSATVRITETPGNQHQWQRRQLHRSTSLR